MLQELLLLHMCRLSSCRPVFRCLHLAAGMLGFLLVTLGNSGSGANSSGGSAGNRSGGSGGESNANAAFPHGC